MQEKALQEEVKLGPAVEEVAKEKEELEPAKEKFVGGEAPAVAAAGLADHGSKTASQLAYDGDSNQTELSTKLGALINTKFGGDLKKAFHHYGDTKSHEPSLDKDELIELLHDADIGNSMNRIEWATALIEKLDKDKDGEIGWKDFQKMVKNVKTQAPAAEAAPVAAAPAAKA